MFIFQAIRKCVGYERAIQANEFGTNYITRNCKSFRSSYHSTYSVKKFK